MLELGFETSIGSRERPEQSVAAERPAVIGRYRILRLIGEGGMGAVYEAEQDHPRRTVALKIIKSGMASAELLRRFEQESQALGRLQHPGIAQIYEAGTVDTGFGPQPYFAMEFIRGRSPREYAEANHLNARDRLQMLVKICDAVHHAHQRGLIHRDLKPGNILVDETGQPKILDFGVVRVTDSDARATLQTDMGQLVGTLAYMSPEQALADPLDIDTRSDVYSLGVILYELLSGRLPYTVSKKVHEAIQAIREEDPARLSSTNRTFRGDIETIVAKALAKERERRYASAAEMAADIQHYLNDEPIVARPPSTSYQLQKFARRNKALVTGIAAVFVILLAAVTAITWYAARVTHERDRVVMAEEQTRLERDRARSAERDRSIALDRAVRAEDEVRGERDNAVAARESADTASATARAVTDFFRDYILTFPDPRNGTSLAAGVPPNPNATIREALDRGAANIPGKFDTEPLVEAELREAIARSYLSLGLFVEGQSQLERAVELRRRIQGQASPDTLKDLKTLMERVGAYGNLSNSYVESLRTEIVEIENHLLGKEATTTLADEASLANTYFHRGKFEEAEALLVKTIAIQDQIPGVPGPNTVGNMILLIEIYQRQGKSEQARQVTNRLETIVNSWDKKDPMLQNDLQQVAIFYMDELQRNAEAAALLARMLAARFQIFSPFDPDTLKDITYLVQAYQKEGEFESANQLSADFERRLRSLGVKNPLTIQLINLFKSRTRRSLPELVDLANTALPRPGEENLGDLQRIRRIALAYYDQDKYGESEKLYVRAKAVSNRLVAKEDSDSAMTEVTLAAVYVLEGKHDEAEETLKDLLSIFRRASGQEARTTLFIMSLLDWTRLHEQRYVDAEVDLRQILRSLEETQPDEWEKYNCQSILGASLVGQKRYAEAEPLLLSAYDGMTTKPSTVSRKFPFHAKLENEGRARILQLYEDWGKPEKAAEWREKLRAAEALTLLEPLRK
jgi:tetratricopeptide (TPR) repeat protein